MGDVAAEHRIKMRVNRIIISRSQLYYKKKFVISGFLSIFFGAFYLIWFLTPTVESSVNYGLGNYSLSTRR